MQPEMIMVAFNLADGVAVEDYLNWAKTVDLPTVNGLSSVRQFRVFQGLTLMGSDTPSPWQYFETIEVADIEAFMAQLQTPQMQAVIADFNRLVCDAQFIRSAEI